VLFKIFFCNSTSGNVAYYKNLCWVGVLYPPPCTINLDHSVPTLISLSLYLVSWPPLFAVFMLTPLNSHPYPNCKLCPLATADLASMLWLIQSLHLWTHIYKFIYIPSLCHLNLASLIHFPFTRSLLYCRFQYLWMMLRSSFQGCQASWLYTRLLFFPLFPAKFSLIIVHSSLCWLAYQTALLSFCLCNSEVYISSLIHFFSHLCIHFVAKFSLRCQKWFVTCSLLTTA